MTAAPLDFWSRRRAAVRAEQAALDSARQADVTASGEAFARDAQVEVMQAKSEAELLSELGLKDPELMQMGDDFSAFMQKAVPEALRRRALRQLWRSNPVLANLDGLVDFGEDFTDTAMVVPGMQTSYMVGKGLLRHVIATTEAAQGGAADEADAAPDAMAQATDDAASLANAAGCDDAPADSAPGAEPSRETAGAPAGDATEAAPRPRRHMRFSFQT